MAVRTVRRCAGRVLVVALLAVTIVAPAGTPPAATATTNPTLTSALVPVGPIRLADTRRPDCGCRQVDASTVTIDVTGRERVPDDAVAAVLTVTALRTPRPGFATAFPAGIARPDTSTVNTRPDRVVANTTIVPLGEGGAVSIHLSEPGGVVVDLTAVFVAAERANAGRYVPVPSSRLVDTRGAAPVPPGGVVPVPLPPGVAADATAVVVNITSVQAPKWGYLTARPADSPPSATSVLNPDGTGAPVAAATIVPVDASGLAIDVQSGGHVLVDLLGWFTGPSAAESTSGLYVPESPRRLLDTRSGPTRIHDGGAIELASPFAGAAALVTNVTSVRADRRSFVTAFPAGHPVPETSTVNPGWWNHTVANLAVTQVSTRGTAYWSSGGTDLLVDVTGWFTGSPVDAVGAVPPNTPRRSRVLLVGDSTLASLAFYTQAQSALVGFDAVVDAASCRRLLRPSCLSDTTGLVPNTAVEAIAGTPGRLDIVVVKAGYNDWFSDFPAEFDAVVRTARAKGAHTIVWMSYNEAVERSNARRAYEENNADLRWLVTRPEYRDVLFADWLRYSNPRPDWFADGTHGTPSGTWALADYVSRWVAAVEHRPCPRPWSLGWATPDPCPPPEIVGPVADPRSLY